MEDRIRRLAEKLPEGTDAALITSGVNRRYYTGMKSTAGLLFLTRDAAYFIIDFRYIEAARRGVRGAEVLLQEKLGEQLSGLAKRHGVKTIAVEAEYMTIGEFLRYQTLLPGCELQFTGAFSELVRSQRIYKSPGEIEKLRTAQEIADHAFADILDIIRPGISEREIALELDSRCRRYGGEGASFDTIAVSGPNTAMPHGMPGERKVQPGDFITMDFGTLYDGYCSDMTRTVAAGKVTQGMKRVYETVLAAQKAAMEIIRPGARCSDVDRAARGLIGSAGYEGCFGHGLGHSLGLVIHEEPRFSPGDGTLLEPGMVLSVEPGVYLEGKFGCRIEDVVVITKDGFENLAKSPKELIEL